MSTPQAAGEEPQLRPRPPPPPPLRHRQVSAGLQCTGLLLHYTIQYLACVLHNGHILYLKHNHHLFLNGSFPFFIFFLITDTVFITSISIFTFSYSEVRYWSTSARNALVFGSTLTLSDRSILENFSVSLSLRLRLFLILPTVVALT